MKSFSEYYSEYEEKAVNQLYTYLISKYETDRKAPYLTSAGSIKNDEYLELAKISDGVIHFRRQMGRTDELSVTIDQLKDAIKLSIRAGNRLRASHYNKMYDKVLTVGSLLKILVHLIPEKEFERFCIIGKTVEHPVLGKVTFKEFEKLENILVMDCDGEEKRINLEYFSIEEDIVNEILKSDYVISLDEE